LFNYCLKQDAAYSTYSLQSIAALKSAVIISYYSHISHIRSCPSE
jgi:hypothetical protein